MRPPRGHRVPTPRTVRPRPIPLGLPLDPHASRLDRESRSRSTWGSWVTSVAAHLALLISFPQCNPAEFVARRSDAPVRITLIHAPDPSSGWPQQRRAGSNDAPAAGHANADLPGATPKQPAEAEPEAGSLDQLAEALAAAGIVSADDPMLAGGALHDWAEGSLARELYVAPALLELEAKTHGGTEAPSRLPLLITEALAQAGGGGLTDAVEGTALLDAAPLGSESAEGMGNALADGDHIADAAEDPADDRLEGVTVQGSPESEAEPTASETAPEAEEVEPPEDPEEPELGTDPVTLSEGDDGWIEYVHTSGDDASSVAPSDPAFISNHDARADHMQRTWVTTLKEGERAPFMDDTTPAPYSPGEPLPEPDPAEAMGKTEGMVGQERTPEATGGATLEGHGQATEGGVAASGSGQQGADSSRAGGASGLPPTAVATAIAQLWGGGAVSGADHGPKGEQAPSNDGPDWWSPSISRLIVVSPPTVIERTATPSPPAPSRGVSQARKTEAPVREAPSDPLPELPEEEVLAELAEVEELSEADGITMGDVAAVVDPLEDLRDELGWGELTRSDLNSRTASFGVTGDRGSVRMSRQTVLSEEYDVVDFVQVRAAATPLGRYMAAVEEKVKEAWFADDLPAHDRALGIQGQVTLQFYIHRSGRVSELVVVTHSGHPSLDSMAIRSVPVRLAKFPEELDIRGIHHRLTLRYRNPLIAGRGE